MGGDRKISDFLKQTLELEVVKLGVRYYVRLREWKATTLWRIQRPEPNEETADSLHAGAMATLKTFENQTKTTTNDGYETMHVR
jgi:hypothetical protein